MRILFSPSTGSFYPSEVDYGSDLPADIHEVSKADFEAAIAARGHGFSVTFKDGELVFVPPEEVSFSGQFDALMGSIRVKRDVVLNRLAGIGMAALVSGDKNTAKATATARQELLDITKAPEVVAATDVDGLKAAVLAVYQGIVASAPAEVQGAFVPLDV